MSEHLEHLAALVLCNKIYQLARVECCLKRKKFYEKARILSLHGMDKDCMEQIWKKWNRYYDVSEIGYKYNLMDLLSVIGIEQLKRLENNLKIRKTWETYHKHFNSKTFDIPKLWDKKIRHSYHLFNIYLNKKEIKLAVMKQ